MLTPKQISGSYYEKLAEKYLKKLGLKLIERNFYSRFGEIDLIMHEETEQLVFIEVRSRKASNFATAAETITRSKQKKIILTAQHFLSNRPKFHHYDCRFDVIAIDYNNQHEKINWLKNAFME